jgi:hypothetical protein
MEVITTILPKVHVCLGRQLATDEARSYAVKA